MARTTFTALACLSFALLASGSPVQLCGQYENQTSSSGLYNIGTDQWGEDGSGAQCVLYDPDSTPEANATAFTVTWAWAEHIDDVHSFPNIAPLSSQFPVQLNNTNSFDVDIAWTMGTGNSVADSTDESDLVAAFVKANVAFDCFLDNNMTSSSNASLAGYEFMVWLASYGGEQPLGYETTQNPLTYTLGGQDFTLYTGVNTQGQHVHSWYPSQSIPKFTANIMELLDYVVQQGLIPADAYLGSVQFGTEATHSKTNVTFSANPVLMTLDVKVPRTSAAMQGASPATALLAVSFFSCLYWFGLW